MEQMRNAFRAEAMDLLIELDSALLSLEQEPGDSSLVHRVFRAIHTIKGSGATAGYAHLARFAHNVEEAFDLARDGKLAVSPDLVDCGLRACDILRLIIEETAEEAAVPGEAEVAAAFAKLLPAPEHQRAENSDDKPPAAEVRAAFEITFKPNREMFYSGSDPVTLLDDLRELGQTHITAHADLVPPLLSLEAEQCYLWWEILLVTESDEATVREVFVFVEDDCELTIRPRKDQEAAVALLGSVPSELFEQFVAECEDHLVEIEGDALALEGNSASRSNVDSLFRGVHSIKGNAGLLLGHVKGATLAPSHPLQLLLRLAHGLESLLEPSRAATADPVSNETIQTTLETCDAIRALLASLTHSGADGLVSPELLERFGIATNATPIGPTPDGREGAFINTTSQSVEMIAGCFQRAESNGGFTRSLLETYLRGLKTLSAAALYGNTPELEGPLADQRRILDAALQTGAELKPEEGAALSRAFQATKSALEHIATGGASGDAQKATAAEAPSPMPLADRRDPLVADRRDPVVTDRRDPPAAPATVRIDQIKLDRLMAVVGELLVARGALPLLVQKLNDGADAAGMVKDLKDVGSRISRIADELQTSVMSIRMLPVKTVFQRFPRLVRDLARSLGKEVHLSIEGDGIELDKTILEQIGDPLVHMIRNAVDHGLELPEVRLASGKESTGQLTLRAFYVAGGVAIEVTDDGPGLDAAALKSKAIEKGLITPEAARDMSEEAAFQLIFLPGFTTAEKVTDVSGRGVGMDVVHSNVRNLQGTVEIRSKRGQGTTFLIKLPTSLMISKGILLHADGQEYILPLGNIRDMIKMPREEAIEFRGQTLAQVRGTIYSIFSLAEMLGMSAAESPELSIAIVEAGSLRYGLVVDKFLTEVEVLVKPLPGGLEQCKEFQGAAIMGDGRVVLVLNALECHRLDGIVCN